MASDVSHLKRPRYPIPDFVREELMENNLTEAYLSRPPYQQNDYIGWIDHAKQDNTKQKRLAQMIDELKRGDTYMKMAYRPKVTKEEANIGTINSNDRPVQEDTSVKTVNDYLEALPEKEKEGLKELRRTIMAAVPDAVEKIRYHIPTFYYHGPLVAFSVPKSRNHCSFHLMSPSLMASHKEELSSYDTTAATIRFSIDKPLPRALVEKLVRERVKENGSRLNSKKELGFE
jgi:uncharacterized protein YdhG (YjbR/CyaY superfamily)